MINPKFSILLPVKNGMPYLIKSVESVLSQQFHDFELVISDDYSDDGSWEFLESLRDKRLRLVRPNPGGLGSSEHWDFLQSNASGDWQIFLGQDDGLQPYFFRLASSLVARAKEAKVRTIASRRALYFWEGAESEDSPSRMEFRFTEKVKIRDLRIDGLKVLVNALSYHELPQAYTNSIWERELFDEIRQKNSGKLMFCYPEDASLAASAFRLEENYLWSGIPLGWVGTSPKSEGLAVTRYHDMSDAITSSRTRQLNRIAEYSLEKSKASGLPYSPLAGSLVLGDMSIYFWHALVATQRLGTNEFDRILSRRGLFFILLATSIGRRGWDSLPEGKKALYRELFATHALPSGRLLSLSLILRICVRVTKSIRTAIRGLGRCRPLMHSARKTGHHLAIGLDFDEANVQSLVKTSNAIERIAGGK